MRKLLPLLIVLVGGAVIGYLVSRQDDGETAPDAALRSAFSRARAFYLNESNEDDRRARLELAPFEDRLQDNAAWRLDMGLIDLAEINHPVQDRDHVQERSEHSRLLQSAVGHLQRAHAIDRKSEAVAYNLARAYRKLAPTADDPDIPLRAAQDLLRPLIAGDVEDPDPAALLLYGTIREEESDYQEAVDIYTRILELGEDFIPATQRRVAEFRQAQMWLRLDPEKGKRAIAAVQAKRRDAARASADALERGRYTKLVELTGPGRSAPDPRKMNWQLVTGRTGLPARGGRPRFLMAPDLDGDCARDVVMSGPRGLLVFRNRRNATFEDLTASAGLPGDFALTSGAAGDLDNDGRCDLVLGGTSGVGIFLNVTDEEEATKWRFVDYSTDGRDQPRLGPRGAEPATCVVLFDFDHDGDLDIFVGGRENRLYRTSVEEPPTGGKFLRFVEMARELGLRSPPAIDAVILDVEDDQDIDLLLVTGTKNVWFENLRQLRFAQHDLPDGAGIGVFDVDNDQQEEIRIGAFAYKWRGGKWERLFERALLMDLDGDGVADSDPLAGMERPEVFGRAIGTDLNRDGNADLLFLTPERVEVYVSNPDRPAAWIDIQPRGRSSNEWGIGTRLRLLAGDLRQGATCRDGLVSFGLGRRTLVDAVALRWTNGVEQGVVGAKLTSCVEVEERRGEVTSCPFLYAYDGRNWHFVNDCQSGTPLGLPYMDRKYLRARPNETVLVPGRLLAPRNGSVRLDLAEEFWELFYVDQVVLRAVDHPAGTRPVLNEGFKVMSDPEFRVHALDDLRPPRSAKDHKGRDILELVRARDRRHAVVWDAIDERYTGLAHPWSIELDLGDVSAAKRVLLVMDGWVEFPTASASIAASQSSTVHFKTPVIEVMCEGRWQVADPDAGFPAGKSKAVLVDLTGKLPEGDGRIRISGTQRIHWDAFLVSTGPDRPLRLTTLRLRRAEHRFRGIGKRIDVPGQPWRYSHDDLVTFFRYDQMPPGKLTRYGDVLPLLAEIDDRYPIMATGDVIELAFDASGLPPLPEGWVRDYCFTTEGWVKDADLNQAVRERVGPLPFRAMSAYPYDEAKEAHPHPDFARQWLTRPTRKLVDPTALKIRNHSSR